MHVNCHALVLVALKCEDEDVTQPFTARFFFARDNHLLQVAQQQLTGS